MYNPWVDRRYSSPLACIGPRQEVWESFEHSLNDNSRLAVIQKWKTSGFREEYLRSAHKAESKPGRLSPLENPVLRASKLVRKWADTRTKIS